MELKALKTLTAAALLAAATSASAGTAPFSMVSGATNPGVDVTLTIQQSVVPGYDYDFVVTNSSLMGIVTGVYFEIDWNTLLNGSGASSGDANLLTGSATPSIAGWEGTDASHTVDTTRVRKWVGRGYKDYFYDNISDGILEGNSQIFSFTAGSGVLSLADLEAMLGTEGFGVAIKMQGLTSDAQATGWGDANEIPQLLEVQAFSLIQTEEPGDNGGEEAQVVSAPSPTAALAGLVIAGIAGLRRRRK